MRWPAVARAVAAVIGLGCAVAIFVYTRNRPQPDRPAMSPPAVDPKSASVGATGQNVYLRLNRSPIKISYATFRTYDDGRMRLDSARIEGLEDSRFTIACDVLETRGKSGSGDRPSHYDCSGHVVLVTDDGLRLECEAASYDDSTNLLTIPGPVAFTKGRLSGNGVGAAYDREADTFTFLDQATARVAADAQGAGAADATATRMSLVRGQHMLRLIGNARIVGQDQTLTGLDATVLFKEDESAIKFLELRGAARVTPSAGASAARHGMSADNITMAFQEDGLTLQHATLTGRAVLTLGGAVSQSIRASYIDFFVAPDGRTVTRLAARDRVVVELAATATTVGRRITSTVLSTTGSDTRGLTSARFEGSPKFEELPIAAARTGSAAPQVPPARTGTSVVLELSLGGRLDAVERADFLQKAEFRDGSMMGIADVAQYNEVKGSLKLIPNTREPRQVSRVTTPDLSVNAAAIDVQVGTQNLDARGNVTTRATQTGKPKSAGSLFQGSEPIMGAAETFQYRKDTGIGTYDGTPGAPARLWQGQTSVKADRIVFTDASRDLDASGRVDSTWELAEDGSAALKRYGVRADIFKYAEARRTAVYTGAMVFLTTADGEIESRRLTLLLASSSRTLESLHAERMDGEYVFATLSGGYEGRGDDLVYRAAGEMYTLKGKPAFAKAPKRQAGASPTGGSDCTLQESLVFEFNRRTNEWRIPGKGEAPRTVVDVHCGIDLRKIKK